MIRAGAIARRMAGAALLLGLLLPVAAAAETDGVWPSPGSIEFVGKNAIATANGRFHRWRFSRVEVDREHPERSVVEVEVDVSSVDTGNGRRDDHLRSDDFFEVERWPVATVRVTDAVADGQTESGAPRYRALFDVTIRDVRKTLEGHFAVLDAEPPSVEGELTLNRAEFGVGGKRSRWNPMSIREEVPIRFRAELPGGG